MTTTVPPAQRATTPYTPHAHDELHAVPPINVKLDHIQPVHRTAASMPSLGHINMIHNTEVAALASESAPPPPPYVKFCGIVPPLGANIGRCTPSRGTRVEQEGHRAPTSKGRERLRRQFPPSRTAPPRPLPPATWPPRPSVTTSLMPPARLTSLLTSPARPAPLHSPTTRLSWLRLPWLRLLQLCGCCLCGGDSNGFIDTTPEGASRFR